MRNQTIIDYDNVKQVMYNALASLMYTTRCLVNHTMQNSPGEIAFGRNMFIYIPVIANLESIGQRRQLLINQNLARQNRNHYDYHYGVNNYIMVKKYDPTKGKEQLHGPYQILECRTNGTIVIRRENPMVQETYNIRKIIPYKGLSVEDQNHTSYFQLQVQK